MIVHPSIIIDGSGGLSRAVEQAYDIAHELTSDSRIEIIEPEKNKKSISIDQARELRRKVTLKSHSETYRVFIIKSISLMGDEAQNSLLKTLEELGDNISIIMPVSTVDEVLPTIRSRSQIVKAVQELNKSKDKKQYLIDSALLGYKNSVSLSEVDMISASEFMRYSVSDRLHHYKKITDDRGKLLHLLHSIRVLCISAMREANQHESKIAWSKKVQISNDLLDKAYTNTSGKLLLLGASTQL